MQKAIWFSRHQPSPEQIKDAGRHNFDLLVTPEGTTLGLMDLQNEGDVKVCVTGLLAHCADQGAVAICGVFPAPILAQIARTSTDILSLGKVMQVTAGSGKGDFPCYAAWNVTRTVEGEKPTFTHKRWVFIGYLSQESCRWLSAS